MKRRWHPPGRLRTAATLILAAAASGCGAPDDLPRQPVSGSVSLDGEPLSGAWIEFRPDGPGAVTASGATVEGGRYDIPRDKGLIPGSYRVAITKAGPPEGAGAAVAGSAPAPGRRAGSRKASAPAPGPFAFAKQLIPARYNVKSELTARVEEGKPNTFDYPLATK